MDLNILFPVFNEELRLKNGIETAWSYLANCGLTIPWKLTIVDNASTDSTSKIARNLILKYSNIFYMRIPEKGVGAAFRAGVLANTSDIIGYMDIDLSTDLKNIPLMINIFQKDTNVSIVNASRYSKKSILKGRTLARNFISYTLIILLKLVFNMKSSDAICGFKFFKKDCATNLLKHSSTENGWFLLIEVLLRAERMNYIIKEIPVTWIYEPHTKVKICKVAKNYIIQILKLRWDFWKEQIDPPHRPNSNK